MNSCDRYERDLLQLVHGQLGPMRGLVARLHVLTCPSCKARLDTFKRLSTRLATGMRRPNSVRPVGAFVPKTAYAFPRIKGLLLLLVGASLVWVYTLTTRASASSYDAATVSTTSHADSCAVAPPKAK
jgi:hypothetical protein